MLTQDEVHKIDAVEFSHWWYRGTREICFSILDPFVAGRRDLRILDVGCGTGGNLTWLAQYGQVRGVDIDPLCVEYARKKGLDVQVGSLQELHAAPESLDLITTFDVLTYTAPEETVGVLRGMREALAPGGLIAFREPAMRIARGAHDAAVNMKQRFEKPAITAALRAAGFEPLRITYLNSLLFPAIVLQRKLQLLANPSAVKSDVEETPEPLNSLLLGILRAEKQLLSRTNMPFGVSLFAVARRVQALGP